MGDTKIQWTEKVWNPVTGCSKISPGCQNCYAKRMSKRLAGRFGYPKDDPFKVTLHPDRLDEPLKWRKPSRIFVCSMSDFLHDDIPGKYIDEIIDVVGECPQHTFLFLTKRPENAKEKLDYWKIKDLQNFWLGVTVEDNDHLWRIDELLKIPAAKRFVSIEPMLGEISFRWASWHEWPPRPNPVGHLDGLKQLDWIILGAESGPKRRPCFDTDILNVVNQCKSAGVPVFIKQIQKHDGTLIKDINLFPPELQIQQSPAAEDA